MNARHRKIGTRAQKDARRRDFVAGGTVPSRAPTLARTTRLSLPRNNPGEGQPHAAGERRPLRLDVARRRAAPLPGPPPAARWEGALRSRRRVPRVGARHIWSIARTFSYPLPPERGRTDRLSGQERARRHPAARAGRDFPPHTPSIRPRTPYLAPRTSYFVLRPPARTCRPRPRAVPSRMGARSRATGVLRAWMERPENRPPAAGGQAGPGGATRGDRPRALIRSGER
jgi:hypothetical protein